MEKIDARRVSLLFQSVANKFSEKKDELCEMDAKMGDGDLGLTMSKGYGALPKLIEENYDPEDIGKTLMKSGMKMSSIVPSTMGTLMSSGIIEGAKKLKGKNEIGKEEFADFLVGFADGIQKRGKCKLGDRTILDSVYPAAVASVAELSRDGASLVSVIRVAVTEAGKGVENTKNMTPVFGKAAVFTAKASGVADQGAIAGLYLLEGFQDFIDQ